MSTTNEKGFRTMADLVRSLHTAEEGLRGGTLASEGIDAACNDARELYERLVVIRHKSREQLKASVVTDKKEKAAPVAQVEVKSAQARPEPAAPAPASTPVAEVKKVSETAPVGSAPATTPAPVPVAKTEMSAPAVAPAPSPVIKLDTKPPVTRSEKAPEVTGMRTAAEFLRAAAKAEASVPETIAEKMEKAHLEDLGKAISLSNKFWFTAELFNGDGGRFDKAIDRLNTAKDIDDASAWMDAEVYPLLKKPADAEARAAFLELLQRRFA